MAERHIKPDIFVLGVGHSGTSLLARILFELGWERNDADATFSESVGLREINDTYRNGLATENEIVDRGVSFIANLQRPFALKDPRLTFTLPLWINVLQISGLEPILLKINRDRSALANSYEERKELFEGAAGMYGRSLDQLIFAANYHFDLWPFSKLEIRYEDIVRAASLIKSERKMRPEGGLWIGTEGV